MDGLPEADERGAEVLYAAAPSPHPRAIARVLPATQLPAQVAVEERMGCGFGLCQTASCRSRARTEAVRPPALVRRRPGVQPRARALGSLAFRRPRRCCRRPPRDCRWCARGRGEAHPLGRPRRHRPADARDDRRRLCRDRQGAAGSGRPPEGGRHRERTITLESGEGSPTPRIAESPAGVVWSTGRRTRASTRSSPMSCPRLAVGAAVVVSDRRRLARGVRPADRVAPGTARGLGDRGRPVGPG